MASSWTALELMEMTRAFQPACVVVAAAELDVFTALGDRPASAEAVAGRIDADVRAVTILLDALVALGLLGKRKGLYQVPPEVADLLSADSPASVLPAVRHQGNCLRRWAQLGQVVRSGTPAERTPSIRGAEADCEAFIGAMNNFTEPVAPEIVGKLESVKFQRLLDIGGASGTWTIAFLRAVPEATAVLLDLPEVIPLARRRLTAAGLIDRVTLVAGDYNVDPLPAGADFAWLSAIAHQNSPTQNRTLYAKIHAALAPGGTLVIRDIVMDSSRTAPPSGALFAVNMLVATEGGNSYTLDEFRDDLAGAGFAGVQQIHKDEWMNSLVRARKA
ncbi:MAG: methyltransferase domain-containing protein [Phycisphaerales bacterium]|nr:MAG: methyltransferase domain-containing protein [Phycisphaerales bacterium]